MLSHRNGYTQRLAAAFVDATFSGACVWIYKAIMLIWAVWLVVCLFYWLRWGWLEFRGARLNVRETGHCAGGLRRASLRSAPSPGWRRRSH